MKSLQKTENNLPATLQQLSQSEFVRTLMASNFKGTSDNLPSTIKGAIEQPPISEVMKITGEAQIRRFVEFELIKMSQLVSVGNNLNNSQVEFIASQLIEIFPNESLADFKICFQRGCIGQYGEIFRMDGIVLRKWMEKYLDEKYETLVDDLNKYKERPYELPDKADEGPGYIAFKEYAKSLKTGMKVPGISDADIKREGKEDAPRKTGTGHPRITEAGLEASQRLDLMREYGRQHTDIYTGKPLPGSPTFEQWVKEKQQEK